MRFVVAKRASRRGEGFGNELLPWAKGWIASRVLDARLVGPSWGLNRRRYFRNFRTSRFDFLGEDLLLHLPHASFTEADYHSTGEIEFGAAVAKWAKTLGLTARSSFIVSVEGMWGGYASIRRARPFLWSKFLASRDALRHIDRVLAALKRDKLFVAVHLRSGCGQFARPMPGENVRGRFNISIPGDWYLRVCRELEQTFPGRIQFWFFTDQPNPDFDEAVRRFNPGQPTPSGLTACSDLLLMALADLRVCSISSYSMAACFLAEGPYIWYEPQLTLWNGLYSLWGDEEARQHASAPPRPSAQFFSGLNGIESAGFLGSPMDIDDPLPPHLLDLLERRLRNKDPRTNLIEYGSCPASLLRERARTGTDGCPV